MNILLFTIIISYDGFGMRGTIQCNFPYEDSWHTIYSICVARSTGKLFVVTCFDIDMYDIENQFVPLHVVDNKRDGMHPHHIPARGSDVIFTDPTSRKVYRYITETGKTDLFSGNGDENSVDGPAFESSFRRPCGIAAEFDQVVHVTDVMSGTIVVTVRFLKAIGGIYTKLSLYTTKEASLKNTIWNQ